MHLRRGGQDVALLDPAVAARPVADPAADLEHQRRACREVARVEVQPEVAVERAGRGPGEVERGRGGAAQVLEAREGARHARSVHRHACLVAEWKAGRYHRLRRIEWAKRRQPFAVQGRALSFRNRELEPKKWRDHDTGDRNAVLHEPHGNGDHGKPASEIGGAVQRADRPHGCSARPSASFRKHGDTWRFTREHLEDGGFGSTVGRRHVIPRAFHLGGTARPGETAIHEYASTGARGTQGDREKVVQTFLSSRPSPNMASRSWAENCWKATIVWVRSIPSSRVRCCVTTLARSSCSRTRTIPMKAQSPVTV